MSTSSIPEAIDGIIATLKASQGLRGVDIIDGAPTTNTPKDFIAVAYAEDGGEVVSGVQTILAMGNLLRDESFDVVCRVSAWNGGTDMKKVRDRAFELFAAVETALNSATTLGGAVTFAQIAPVGFAQYQTDQGAVADIDFTVSVRTARF